MIKSGTVLTTMELDGKLYFAADRRISWHWGKAASTPTKKVAKRNGILMSGTGSASLVFEVIHRCKIPVFTQGQDIDKYVYNKLLPAIIGDLRYKGYVDGRERRMLSKHEKSDDGLSAIILIGIKSGKKVKVFELDLNTSMITVDQVPTDYAHGCGGDFAQAIITYTKSFKGHSVGDKGLIKETEIHKLLGLTAKEILEHAIQVAAIHSPGCDNTVDIEVL
jgi:hypothetical protein